MRIIPNVQIPAGKNSTGVSQSISVSGIGFAIVPARTPNTLQFNTVQAFAVPGDFPLVAEITGQGFSDRLFVHNSDVFHYSKQFTSIQLTLADPTVSSRQRFSAVWNASNNNVPYFAAYDVYVFANTNEYLAFVQSPPQLRGSTTYITPLQNWAQADFAGSGNDPVTLNDSTGQLGVDCKGHEWCRVILAVGSTSGTSPAGAGTVELWVWDILTGSWCLPSNAAFKATPAAQAAQGNLAGQVGQLVLNVQLGYNYGRVYPVANNVTNNAGNSTQTLQFIVTLN